MINCADLRAIDMSGYSPEIGCCWIELQEGANFLALLDLEDRIPSKPFHSRKLAETVRETLDQVGGSAPAAG